MICTRFLENKHFVPQKYWQLKLQAAKDNVSFVALSADKYDKQQAAIDTLQKIKEAKTVQVKTVERKEVSQEPPLLYDLTSLQKEANTKLNFSADKTLSIAQKLYEGKLISYLSSIPSGAAPAHGRTSMPWPPRSITPVSYTHRPEDSCSE